MVVRSIEPPLRIEKLYNWVAPLWLVYTLSQPMPLIISLYKRYKHTMKPLIRSKKSLMVITLRL